MLSPLQATASSTHHWPDGIWGHISFGIVWVMSVHLSDDMEAHSALPSSDCTEARGVLEDPLER